MHSAFTESELAESFDGDQPSSPTINYTTNTTATAVVKLLSEAWPTGFVMCGGTSESEPDLEKSSDEESSDEVKRPRHWGRRHWGRRQGARGGWSWAKNSWSWCWWRGPAIWVSAFLVSSHNSEYFDSFSHISAVVSLT